MCINKINMNKISNHSLRLIKCDAKPASYTGNLFNSQPRDNM